MLHEGIDRSVWEQQMKNGIWNFGAPVADDSFSDRYEGCERKVCEEIRSRLLR